MPASILSRAASAGSSDGPVQVLENKALQHPETIPAQVPDKEDSFRDAIFRIGLILAVLFVFAQLRHADLIMVDDPDYLIANDHIQAGATLENLQWALQGVVSANWMPVTLLTHIVAYQLFGMDPGPHHLLNVLFHALATLFLFAFLRRATGTRWPSAFIALVFAVHPLHVESVAWISERKAVLCAMFWFAAMYTYTRYVERPGLGRYLFVLAAVCLAMMSKPMAVTLPFTLLLLDIWPLRRLRWPGTLLEKLPMFACSVGLSIVTYRVQGSSGAFSLSVPLAERIQHGLIAYAAYLAQMFWPTGMSPFYPYPRSVAAWQLGLACALLLYISAMAVWTRQTRPYFIAGWLWYLGTLVPVIGLVQVGTQSHADRYTYLPMLGILWIVVWGAKDLLAARPKWKPVLVGAGALACSACLGMAWVQASYWQNGVKLFQHAVDVNGNDEVSRKDLSLSHNQMGAELGSTPGHYAEAMEHFQTAIALDPGNAQAHRNLGMLIAWVPGRQAEALRELRQAMQLAPSPDVRKLIEQLDGEPLHAASAGEDRPGPGAGTPAGSRPH